MVARIMLYSDNDARGGIPLNILSFKVNIKRSAAESSIEPEVIGNQRLSASEKLLIIWKHVSHHDKPEITILSVSSFPSIFLLFGLPNACAIAAERSAHIYRIARTPPQMTPVLSPIGSEMDMQPNLKTPRPTVDVDGTENII